VGVERRRFWPVDFKLLILREVGVGGTTVTDIALRQGLTRQHIYQWRRQMKDKGLWPEAEGVAFLGVDAPELPTTCNPGPPNSSAAEIGFADGRVLHYPPGMSEAEIIQLIRLVETA
ncbi:transposase, partial [Actibacterium sp. 188UL27-1]|uniref:transposase n=1 Tax=Actibacterium sp. 188UL27-1 TaxID=2786961 RepID=UPI00195E0FEA